VLVLYHLLANTLCKITILICSDFKKSLFRCWCKITTALKQVVKVIWQRQCASHEGILAPPGEYDWLCFLQPTWVHNPNGKLIGWTVFAQLTTESLYFTMGAPFTQIAPCHGGSEPHVICDSLGQSKTTTQMASLSVQPFLHRWLHSFPILYNGPPFPLKIAPSYGSPI